MTRIAARRSGKGKKTQFSPTFPSGVWTSESLTPELLASIGEWISSRLDSRASHSQSQGSEGERATSGTCGRQPQTLFRLSDHDTFCLRMCQEYASTCPWSSETCADLATVFDDPSSLGLTMLEDPTGGSGCGLWPTPNTFDATCGDLEGKEYTGENRHAMKLIQAVRMWPTPSTRGYKDGTAQSCENVPENCLLGRAIHWRTPNATDWKNRGTEEYREGREIQLQTQVAGQLNPDWVEWLMGWPIGWTRLEPIGLDWRTWETDPADSGEIPRVTTGKKDRVQRLKALGNGQVPAVVRAAWEILTSC